MTDEQIDQLLVEAEARLREKAALLSTPARANEIRLDNTEAKARQRKPYVDQILLTASLTDKISSLPKLRHGLGQQTYIKDSQGVAQTKPQAAIPQDQRKLADGLRTVEVAQKAKKIVCSVMLSPAQQS